MSVLDYDSYISEKLDIRPVNLNRLDIVSDNVFEIDGEKLLLSDCLLIRRSPWYDAERIVKAVCGDEWRLMTKQEWELIRYDSRNVFQFYTDRFVIKHKIADNFGHTISYPAGLDEFKFWTGTRVVPDAAYAVEICFRSKTAGIWPVPTDSVLYILPVKDLP